MSAVSNSKLFDSIHAPYASNPAQSRGRLYKEAESLTRSAFQRDRDRVLHSKAFRYLMYKTQVFVTHIGDYYRTRLTHSLEVAQIARSIARELRLNEDLTEALALCHDLGHPPFGHAGEEALNEAMQNYGGFDHNAQSLRIVTHLEQHYAEFDGLNLTWETLEGLVKPNGPLLTGGKTLAELPFAICTYAEQMELELATQPGPEAQIAALSDDIAYNHHDLDDGLRAGLFTIEQVPEMPRMGNLFQQMQDLYPDSDAPRLRHEAIRRMIAAAVDALVAETQAQLAHHKPQTVSDIRSLDKPIAVFPADMIEYNKQMKAFFNEHLYTHYKIMRAMSKAKRVVHGLFTLFENEIELLPTAWRAMCDKPKSEQTARVICDYIAGMSDRYAMEEYDRLFDLTAKGYWER